jgi:hypothetical protein
MGLPAGQQRILDGIAEALGLSEPRLESMFAIFTRLAKDDPPPRRERLAATSPLAALLALGRSPSRRYIAPGRRTRKMMLVISQLAIAFIVLAALMGLTGSAAARCASAPRPVASAAGAAARQVCTAAAGGVGTAGK